MSCIDVRNCLLTGPINLATATGGSVVMGSLANFATVLINGTFEAIGTVTLGSSCASVTTIQVLVVKCTATFEDTVTIDGVTTINNNA